MMNRKNLNQRSRNWTVLVCRGLAYTALSLLSACQFRAPSIAEQQALMQKGAFPAGTPGWVATPRSLGSIGQGGGAGGGLIPQSYTAAGLRDRGGAAMTAEESRSSAGTFTAPTAVVQKPAAEDEQEAKSPLHRIGKLCPTIETEVSDALTTTDLKQRIRKYESLTLRCPQSEDLWIWLGKDYAKDGDDVKAGRCYDKALVANASSKEANELASENRKKLNAGPGKKDES